MLGMGILRNIVIYFFRKENLYGRSKNDEKNGVTGEKDCN